MRAAAVGDDLPGASAAVGGGGGDDDGRRGRTLTVRMSDCCLQGIEPCKCKRKGYQWFGNRVFRLGSRKELRKE